MSSQDQCEKCGERYTDTTYKWCKPCQINNLKKNFANWTSGVEKLDDCIRKAQLKIKDPSDSIFEWLPYDQLSDIKKMSKNADFDIFSAIWEVGPLKYDVNKREY